MFVPFVQIMLTLDSCRSLSKGWQAFNEILKEYMYKAKINSSWIARFYSNITFTIMKVKYQQWYNKCEEWLLCDKSTLQFQKWNEWHNYMLQVLVNVGWIYSHFYSGMIFQVAVDVVRKKKTVSEVLATGGRYDHLVRELIGYFICDKFSTSEICTIPLKEHVCV